MYERWGSQKAQKVKKPIRNELTMSTSTITRAQPHTWQTCIPTWPPGLDDEPASAPKVQPAEPCDPAERDSVSERRQRLFGLVLKLGPANVRTICRRSDILGYDFWDDLRELARLGRVVRFKYRGRDYAVAAEFQERCRASHGRESVENGSQPVKLSVNPEPWASANPRPPNCTAPGALGTVQQPRYSPDFCTCS
jgi:hypothetical protein